MPDTDNPAYCVTDYKLGQDNIQLMGLDIHNPVFGIAAFTIVLFVVFSLLFQSQATELFSAVRNWTTSSLDWLFMIAARITDPPVGYFLWVFSIFINFHRHCVCRILLCTARRLP